MGEDRRDRITLVCPVYCEEENLEAFYDELGIALKGADFDLELLFVDDGSSDRSPAILRDLADRDPRVRVLRFSRNFGSIAALQAGLYHATGDAVAIMSVDLQDPPSLLLEFVEQWRSGYDVIWGVRDSRDDPPLKSALARGFYWAVRRLAFPDYPTNGMDTGLFDRRVVDVYRTLPERNSTPIGAIYDLGFPHTRVRYARRARTRGESHWPFWRRVKSAVDLITGFSYAPIRMITLLGLGSFAASLIYALTIVFDRVVRGLGDSGWPSLAVLVLFMGGVQMISLGIIAEYLWRTAEGTRQRPRYVIVDDYGKEAPGRGPHPRLDPYDLKVTTRSRTR